MTSHDARTALLPCRPQLLRLSVAVAVITLLTSGHAAAQEGDAPTGDAEPTESMADSTATESEMADAQARGHFRVARTLYDAGRFAESATEFEAAYGLSGRPDLLYNIYLAHRDAQNEEAALVALRNYLAAVPDAPDHAHLTARLAALEETVAAEQAEEEAREEERAEAERRIAEAQAETERNRARTRPLWPWGLIGGGAILVGVGIALAVVANDQATSLRAACDTRLGANICNPSVNLDARRSDITTLAGVGDALWITGAVAALAGTILYILLPEEVADAPAVSASCGPTGCYGSLEISF